MKNKEATSHFAKNIAAVLKEKGMTAKAGAKLAGVPVSTFTAWANGTATPLDFAAINRFCKGTDVDFEWVLTGSPASRVSKPEDLFEVVNDDSILRGIYFIEAKRLKPKGSSK